MDNNEITSTNFDYDIYSGGSADKVMNEMYAEVLREAQKAQQFAAHRPVMKPSEPADPSKSKLPFTGVENISYDNFYDEPVQSAAPQYQQVQGYSGGERYGQAQGARPQAAPQQPIPEYQVGANDPYATDNFQSTYTDTSNYQAEAMAAQLRGQTVTYGQQMYGSSPQQSFVQPNVQQGGITREQGIAMVDQMMSQDRMMSRGDLYTGSGARYSGNGGGSSAARPAMSRRERGIAQAEQMMAEERASHQTADSFIRALGESPMSLGERRSGHSYGSYDMFGSRRYDTNDDYPVSGEMAWYFLWFAAGALIPFGAFGLAFEFCIIVGAVFGLIGAVVKHNGKEGFDLQTSLRMSKTEILLIPICAVIGAALYFFY